MTLPHILIENHVRAALEEDLAYGRDVTSELTVPAGAPARAQLRAREDGVLAGLVVGLTAFTLADPDFDITVNFNDGDALSAGDVVADIEGPARALLSAERVCLNFISHLSGIASETARYVDAISGTAAQICDTRKTLPGLRALQKYAVVCGGGSNHRFGLGDAILIKDNHIAIAGGIEPALESACMLAGHTLKVEIEVDTLDQLKEVLAFEEARPRSVDIVMLDNMDIPTLSKAVKLIDRRITSEASGGVTLESVRGIAETGVDYISVGALTHSVRALDLGLDINIHG